MIKKKLLSKYHSVQFHFFQAIWKPSISKNIDDKKIVHLEVVYEKFTQQYINFMKQYMPEYRHIFIVTGQDKYPLIDHTDVYFIEYFGRIFQPKYMKILESSKKIIISGLFSDAPYLLPDHILGKTYIQLWGGDFYSLREMNENAINYNRIIDIFRKCAAIINLIPSDYDFFRDITGLNKKHYVCGMPDPLFEQTCKLLLNQAAHVKVSSPFRVLLGNSSTIENCHRDAIDRLATYKNDDIEIFCPLSYGDMKYRDEIIQYGYEKLGNKFIPITKFMPLDDYISFLAEISVGIFANNRQQGGGNIFYLAFMKSKVFMRKTTSLWTYYTEDMKLQCFDYQDVGKCTFDDFVKFSTDQAEKNYQHTFVYSKNYLEDRINEWKAVFESDRISS